jgi:hypothetical protein
MTEKTTKPVRRRLRATKPKTESKTAAARRRPTHAEISERAYFIHLDGGGSDELGDWLRAESELVAA